MTTDEQDYAAMIMPHVAHFDGLTPEEKRPALLQIYEVMGRLAADAYRLQAAGGPRSADQERDDMARFVDGCVDLIVQSHVSSGLVDPDFDARCIETLLLAFKERLASLDVSALMRN